MFFALVVVEYNNAEIKVISHTLLMIYDVMATYLSPTHRIMFIGRSLKL